MTAERAGKRLQREELAVAALLSEPTIEAAAKKAGVSESTLLRWLQEPSFKERHRAARRAVVEGVIGRLQQSSGLALDALVRNLACGTAAVEVSAAKAILDLTTKALDTDTADRLVALEQALNIEQRTGIVP
jgi:hypothetical protein